MEAITAQAEPLGCELDRPTLLWSGEAAIAQLMGPFDARVRMVSSSSSTSEGSTRSTVLPANYGAVATGDSGGEELATTPEATLAHMQAAPQPNSTHSFSASPFASASFAAELSRPQYGRHRDAGNELVLEGEAAAAVAYDPAGPAPHGTSIGVYRRPYVCCVCGVLTYVSRGR